MLYKKIQKQNHDTFDLLNYTTYYSLTNQSYYALYDTFHVELTNQINQISTALVNNIK